MRVLIVTTWFPSRQHPGTAVFCQRHAEAIAMNHEVRVLHVVPPGASSVDLTGMDVAAVPGTFRRPLSAASALREVRHLGSEWGPDIVHTMGFSSLVYGGALRGRAPWIHTEHWSGVADPSSVGPLWRSAAAARHLLRLPDRVTAVSTFLADAVKPFARDVRVVPNVVDGPASPPPRDLGGTLNVLCVGALRRVKDPLLAVRTAAELRRRNVDIRMRWAGAGPLGQEVVDLIHSLGLEDGVTLLGQVPPEDLERHYAWSSVLLATSHLETFSVAGAESLLHGRPVVMGAVGGQRDFVGAQCGALVHPRTPMAFADAVEAVTDRFRDTNPEELARPVRERFSRKAIAEAFDQAYAGLHP